MNNFVYIITPDERRILNQSGDRMPIGARYLESTLNTHGIKSRTLDLNHLDTGKVLMGFSELKMTGEKPRAICFSTMTPTAKQTKELSRKIKKTIPNVPLYVGGFHPTNKHGDFEGIAEEVRGYGEDKLLAKLTDTKPREFDINRYPIPKRETRDIQRYRYNLDGLVASTMITSRGCPNGCVFCSNYDKEQKRRNPENIEEELKQIKSQGYKGVYFLDDNFTLNPNHAINVATMCRKLNLKFRIEARADTMKDYLAQYLGEAGCLVAGLGIESGNDRILQRSGKNQTTEQVRKAVINLNKYGVKTKGFFIIGLPGEDEESAKQTIEYARELHKCGLHYADFYPLIPFPGSPVHRMPDRMGIKILDNDSSKYISGGKELYIPTETEHLPRDKIKELIMEARSEWKK
ncbi:MAG: B12-binding domain-containing radical SAM protein [Promethearchaeota archaeon]